MMSCCLRHRAGPRVLQGRINHTEKRETCEIQVAVDLYLKISPDNNSFPGDFGQIDRTRPDAL